jgi:multidrug efflux pump subunit AcrB
MQEVEEVKSISRAGESLVKVEAKLAFSHSQAELDQVWDKLRSKIQEVSRALPPGAATPVVKGDFGDVFALFYAITGDGYSPRQLYDYVDFLRRELALVPGVARVALLGERKEAIFVEISRARAAQLGIPPEKIHAALRAQNVISPAGNVVSGDLRLMIQPEATVDSVDTLKNLVIAGDTRSGLVRLADIAEIRREYQTPPAVLVRHDGRPAIGLGIANTQGGNVVAMGDAVKRRLAELEGQRPVGMELNVVSFQSDSVRAAVDGFVENLVAAVVIVVIVLLLFMGVRSGLIIGAVLVLTVAGTLIAMLADGIAMQRISLGALIIALGMLVDNAIVVTDGILVRLQKGEQAAAASVAVVKATLWPLLGGTVVGIVAFSAIGLSPSDMGEYAGSLFWVILYSMLLSWLFAITLTPLFCVAFLKVKATAAPPADGRLLIAYRRLLDRTLTHRKSSGLALIGLFVAGVIASALSRRASCRIPPARSSSSTSICRRVPTSTARPASSPEPRKWCAASPGSPR